MIRGAGEVQQAVIRGVGEGVFVDRDSSSKHKHLRSHLQALTWCYVLVLSIDRLDGQSARGSWTPGYVSLCWAELSWAEFTSSFPAGKIPRTVYSKYVLSGSKLTQSKFTLIQLSYGTWNFVVANKTFCPNKIFVVVRKFIIRTTNVIELQDFSQTYLGQRKF